MLFFNETAILNDKQSQVWAWAGFKRCTRVTEPRVFFFNFSYWMGLKFSNVPAFSLSIRIFSVRNCLISLSLNKNPKPNIYFQNFSPFILSYILLYIYFSPNLCLIPPLCWTIPHQEATSLKMPSESGERRVARPQQVGGHPPQSEHLPCPRCDSTNTKYCYYNNYNLSQPRHFCKSCRRYWTQGGTLRNIPVGGGTRKNSKRSRTATSSSSSTLETTPANPISVSPVLKAETETPQRNGLSLNGDVSGGFTSLLNSQGPGFLALNGFSLGLGPGFDEMGFGPAKGVWSYPDVGDVVLGGDGTGSGGGSASSSICNTWQLSGGEVGFVDGDCFAWPDLAISTPGQGLKWMAFSIYWEKFLSLFSLWWNFNFLVTQWVSAVVFYFFLVPVAWWYRY